MSEEKKNKNTIPVLTSHNRASDDKVRNGDTRKARGISGGQKEGGQTLEGESGKHFLRGRHFFWEGIKPLTGEVNTGGGIRGGFLSKTGGNRTKLTPDSQSSSAANRLWHRQRIRGRPETQTGKNRQPITRKSVKLTREEVSRLTLSLFENAYLRTGFHRLDWQVFTTGETQKRERRGNLNPKKRASEMDPLRRPFPGRNRCVRTSPASVHRDEIETQDRKLDRRRSQGPRT